MPKKTKKQKMQASLRKVYSFTNIGTQPTQEKNITLTNTISNEFLIKDLRKTLVLSTLAILFELVLYWRLR